MEKLTKIINYSSDLKFNNLAVTIGAYDGIHNGHIAIFKKLSEQKSLKAVITFDVHPDYVLNKRKDTGKILTIEEKARVISKYNIDYLIILDSTILDLSYFEFNDILTSLGVKTIVVGSDFRYGKSAIGSTDTLDSFNLIVIDLIMDNKQKLSSNTIREYLRLGKVDELTKYGFDLFEITGVVTSGAKLGRKLGFPTANISIGDKYTDIRKGVYATNVIIDNKTYLGVCNIGINPTVNTQDKTRLEVFIIDENIDLYDKKIKVVFRKFIRDEKKFIDTDELVSQITKDVELTKKFLGEN